MILFAFYCNAADLWLPAPALAGNRDDHWELSADVAWEAQVVPPFRVAARDRLAVGLGGDVSLGRVQLGINAEWLRDQVATGEVTSGFGDIHLGTAVRVVSTGPVDWMLGWEAKMPNASDAGELGTDETDVLFGLGAAGRFGPIGARLGAGLAVMGNPLRFANQDDVPLVRGGVAWTHRTLTVSADGRWDVATSRNPHRAAVAAELRYGTRFFGALGGTAGLSEASADWSARLEIGWRAPLPARDPGA